MHLFRRFRKGVVAGTFSFLHKGHKELLRTALTNSEKLIICITTDEFAKRLNKKHPIESFDERVKNLISFIKKEGNLSSIEIYPLNDIYGIAIKDPQIEVLFVSEETFPRALEVSKKRVELGMKPLYIWAISMVLAENGKPISSTRIWKKEIDKEGRRIKLK